MELQQNVELPQGYHQFSLPRPDGSTIRFFGNFEKFDLSKPTVVWLQGSGYHSLFPKRNGRVNQGAYCWRPRPQRLLNHTIWNRRALRGVAEGTESWVR